MTEKIRIAVPSLSPGGVEAELSGHFGHCDVFTIVDLDKEGNAEVSLLPNVDHVQGGCQAPVNLLAQNGVQVLIAGGMGARPLMGFNQAGIEVFFSNGAAKVGQAVSALAQGQLSRFAQENLCSGH